MKKTLTTLLFISILIPFTAFSQQADSTDDAKPIPITAKFDGTLKTKLEMSTEAGVMRFNVRNSRLGVRGNIGDYVSYRVQVELSSEGSFSPLDLSGTIKPANGLSINFGQTHVPFENSYIITPGDMMFANRAFVGKFFTPGSRDIGAVVNYKFSMEGLPLEAQAGVFNGGKINNPQWTDNPSYAFRLIAGEMEGLRVSAKMYRYHSLVLDQLMLAADVHYQSRKVRIEAEAMNRHSYTTDKDLFGAYAQGAYTMYLSKAKMFHYVMPAMRWDAMGYGVGQKGFDVNRLTLGVNFGLTKTPGGSVIRLDYEQYFLRKGVSFVDFEDRDLHVAYNKITLELLLRF